MKNYIAVDIGASSGRAVLAHVEDGDIKIQEINRFANGFTTQNQQEVWDVDYLFDEIIISLERAQTLGVGSCYLSIDTWGIDYIFLDDKSKRLQEAVSYRDTRTNHTMEKVFQLITKHDIYNKTGIQFLQFNTLFQLYEECKSVKQQAEYILLVPDYLNFRLTGRLTNEVTNLSTTQLLDLYGYNLNNELLEIVDIKPQQFAEVVEPGTYLGDVRPDIHKLHNLPETCVYATASHDTASAVLGSVGHSGKDWAFLSSGTWSLIGQELSEPIVYENAFNQGYSNERGIQGTYRFLKNIIGMWIIQRVRKDWPKNYTFPEMVKQAQQHTDFKVFVDFNDARFINPNNMVEAIQTYCIETGQSVPQTIGELAQTVYLNLAIIYAVSIEALNEITGSTIEVINIVGGGSNNEYLNELTAYYTNCDIIVGPVEATVFGNLAATMIATEQFKDIAEARQAIAQSNMLQHIMKPKDTTDRITDINLFKEATQYAHKL